MQLTDIQLLTMAIAVLVPLSLLLYSNSRITDTKEALRAEIGESKQTLRLEMANLKTEMVAGFARIEAGINGIGTKLEIHELEHHRK